MTCPDDDLLCAFDAGALAVSERAGIANHAEACSRCRALLSALLTGRSSAAARGDAGDGANSAEPLEADPCRAARPGARVGRYILAERLGAGGMGVVYAAVDSELQRRVAVKLLHPDRDGAAGAHERLLREARTLAKLSHPNVVTVFDIGSHDGQLFVAMELIGGGNLGSWLRRAPHTTTEIVDRLLEAGRGLAAAHAANVVHRDVKPDNILVGGDGHARVTDFGLARLAAGPRSDAQVASQAPGLPALLLTQTGTQIGTPAYMAPEHLADGEADARTDQWAFCATLYEAVAGVRPFPIDDLDARGAAIAVGRLAPPLPARRVPRWLREIVMRGLRADPAARWPSMDALLAALARGRHRSRRAGIAAGAAVVLIAALALARRDPRVVAQQPTHVREQPTQVQQPPTQARAQHTPGPQQLMPQQPARVASTGDPTAPSPDGAWHSPVQADVRHGCNCPYSSCVGRCLSVCNAAGYRLGARVPGVSVPGRQEALLGASLDGATLLYLIGNDCLSYSGNGNHLMLARQRGATFESVDLTGQLAGMAPVEGCCTLASDAGSLVVATIDHTGFASATLVGSTLGQFDATSFAALGQRGPGITVSHPVLSADGLTLYYNVDDRSVTRDDRGPLDGPYVAVRSERGAPFGRGRRIPGRPRIYEYITGISADGLTLFMAADYETRVLVRASPAEPFDTPVPTGPPATLSGWRAVPFGDCQRILTTMTTAGCRGEDIVYLDAVSAN